MKFYTISEVIEFLQEMKEKYGDLPTLIVTDNGDGSQDFCPLAGISVYEPNESKGEYWCLFCDVNYNEMDEDTD